MTDKDFAISPVGIPSVGHLSKKPIHLVSLVFQNGKHITLSSFLAIDKPELLEGFVQARGFYLKDKDVENIASSYNEIITQTSKDNIVEIMFPWHVITSIQSLIYRAK